ncbi:FeoA family protein [Buchananella hordeovulneris]|uniref:Ferrous iron transporter FeoA-like domain-containing protein n=1 Tax=Buchananella hordeovulneris TaxID=52770 RepID=A0A1Q5PX78_9ACTO|nr:FeoA family protein [Buchananella hordeovulneris]MDO5081256.1 FeoA family protein [Buchananella hordeovulneris]OKL52059.1 hypothetical protein BSZ40_03850 [Buchananella hordeovulneris]
MVPSSRRAHSAEPAGVEVSLASLRPGQVARVEGLAPSVPLRLAQRLKDLGFASGNMVEVVRRAPFWGPTVFRILDYEICLRRHDAKAIRVVAR